MPPLGDDPSISNDAEIWRRVPFSPKQMVYLHEENRWRPSSGAFLDSSDDEPMSALLGDGDTLGRALSGKWSNPPGSWFIAALQAAEFRRDAQGIARQATPEDPNHLLVFGHKTRSRMRRWAECSRWVVGQALPPPPE